MSLNTSINTPYLVLTGVVLIAIVCIFAIIRPQLNDSTELRNEIDKNKATLATKQEFLSALNVKAQQLQSQPDAERQLAVVVPATDMTQDVLRVIDQYAAQSNITTLSVSNTSAQRQAELDATVARGELNASPSTVRPVSFEVNSTGPYPQVRDFLKMIEKSPRIIDVIEVEFKQLSQLPGQISAKLTMQAYSQGL